MLLQRKCLAVALCFKIKQFGLARVIHRNLLPKGRKQPELEFCSQFTKISQIFPEKIGSLSWNATCGEDRGLVFRVRGEAKSGMDRGSVSREHGEVNSGMDRGTLSECAARSIAVWIEGLFSEWAARSITVWTEGLLLVCGNNPLSLV